MKQKHVTLIMVIMMSSLLGLALRIYPTDYIIWVPLAAWVLATPIVYAWNENRFNRKGNKK